MSALALGMEKGDPDIMKQPPRPPKEPVINRPMLRGMALISLSLTAVVLAAFLTGMRWGKGDPTLARTMAFVTLALGELPLAYTIRSERYPLLRLGLFTNPYMQYAVGASAVLLLAAIYVPFLQPVFDTVPLGWREWGVLLPLIFVPAVVSEVNKALQGYRAYHQ